MALLRLSVCLLFLLPLAPLGAAEIRSLTVIHDGSVQPPGFKLEATLKFAPNERDVELSLRVMRVVADQPLVFEPVASVTDSNRDDAGKYLQRLTAGAPAATSTASRLVTVEAVVAYRDLALPRGDQRLVFQFSVVKDGVAATTATSDVITLTVSDARRVLASAADPEELQRWQVPKSIALPRPAQVERTLVAGQEVVGGYQSNANDPRERQFFAEVEVAQIYFATNRVANTALPVSTRPEFLFSPIPSTVSYGHCQVQVLRRTYEEKKALRGRPLSFGELQNYFAVLETHFADRAAFASDLSQDDVLLYIHGYDNTFEDALLRAAQLQLDLDFPGKTVAFSWPSLGKEVAYADDDPEQGRLAYRDDLQAADASVEALVETLQTLAPAGRGRRIHVVAHSMGNRILLGALRQLAASGQAPLIDQLVMAAPDVAVKELAEAEPALAQLAGRTTIYCSQKDIALMVSSRIHALLDALLAERAGGLVRCYPRCDSISADLVNSYFAMNGGHCYFAEAPQMVQDLHLLVCFQLPPDQRPTIQPRSCMAADERSWELHK
jgi:esterase/lipase superfamily enzyme